MRPILRAWLSLPTPVRAAAPFCVMGLLWWLSSQPPSDAAPDVVRSFLHNAMHIVAYAALGGSVLLWLGAALRAGILPRRAVFVSVAVAVGYGVVDELHQSTVPGRVCSVVDIVSDAMGALLAVALIAYLLAGRRGWARLVPFALLGGMASVTLATFGPW